MQDDCSSPLGSPIQSPTWIDRGTVRKGKAPARTSEDGGVETAAITPPIYLSGRPVERTDEELDSRRQFSLEINRANSTPYSTSTPGYYFGAHMEKRDRDISHDGSRNDPAAIPSSLEADSHLANQQGRTSAFKSLLKPLENYIVTSFGSFECINASFSTMRPRMVPRATSEGGKRALQHPIIDRVARPETQLSEIDAKTLLLGDFAENGSWWTELGSPERSRTHRGAVDGASDADDMVTIKSPRMDWAELNGWYSLVINAGKFWRRRLNSLMDSELYKSRIRRPSDSELDDIENEIMEAQFHVQRVLLKAIENLLKRPGRPLTEPDHLRFLLIVLTNPLLYPSQGASKGRDRSRSRSRELITPSRLGEDLDVSRPRVLSPSPNKSNIARGSTGQHSGIIKRILGLMSNVPNECHHHLVSWFARYSDAQFQRMVDLIGSFVTYRLMRQHGRRQQVEQDPTAGLIPSMSGSGRQSSAALHAALGATAQSAKKNVGNPKLVIYNDDWQIKAAARVMALLFSANNSGLVRRGELRMPAGLERGHSAGLAAREKAQNHGQILPISDFYNTLLDYSDLVTDFEAWESKRGKFAFCQYPFFLSIWAKIQIMEHDARRQMEVKAREAFFDSIMTRKTVNQYLVLRVRRDCLVEDSLKSVSEVVGTGGEEIKKGLRIEFRGEEGIDAGGLRKEWFLLLVRDVFNPEHGKPTSLIYESFL